MTGHLSDVMNKADWSVIAVDWTGMADRDRGEITMIPLRKDWQT